MIIPAPEWVRSPYLDLLEPFVAGRIEEVHDPSLRARFACDVHDRRSFVGPIAFLAEEPVVTEWHAVVGELIRLHVSSPDVAVFRKGLSGDWTALVHGMSDNDLARLPSRFDFRVVGFLGSLRTDTADPLIA